MALADLVARRAEFLRIETELQRLIADLDRLIAAEGAAVIPPVIGVPGSVTATNVKLSDLNEQSMTLTFDLPPTCPKALVSWGRTSQEAKTFLAPTNGQCKVTISQLRPSSAYTVDVLAQQPDGSYGGNVRVIGTTKAGIVPPVGTAVRPTPPADVNDLAGWATFREGLKAWAGAPSGLNTLTKASDSGIPGAEWDGKILRLPSGGRLSGLVVPGYILYSGFLDVEAVHCQGIAAINNVAQGFKARQVTVVRNSTLPLGQGAIHAVPKGWYAERCDLSGFSDGIQGVGPGRLIDSRVHDLVFGLVPSGIPTHNDGIQNYGGNIEVLGCDFSQPAKPGSTNGALFSSNNPAATFIAESSVFEVTPGADGTTNRANVLHANTGTITCRRCLVKGGVTIGKVYLTDCARIEAGRY